MCGDFRLVRYNITDAIYRCFIPFGVGLMGPSVDLVGECLHIREQGSGAVSVSYSICVIQY